MDTSSAALLLSGIVLAGALAALWYGHTRDGEVIMRRQMTDQLNELQATVTFLQNVVYEQATQLLDAQLALRRQAQQLTDAGITPMVDMAAAVPPMNWIELKLKLFNALSRSFGLEEIRDLGWQLFNLSSDDLSGQVRAEAARELIDYAVRRGRLIELQEAVAKARPLLRL